MKDNQYQKAARMAKAIALVALLDANSIGSVDASNLTDNDWIGFAKDAGVNQPSSETQRMVIEILAGQEMHRVLARSA